MTRTGRIIASALVVLGLATSSTAGAAAPPAQPAAQPALNPWLTLSVMTPVAATTLGAAGVAAQPSADAPPPPPPPPEDGGGVGIGNIPIPVLAIWLGTIVAMVYIATHDDSDRLESPE